MAERVRSIVRAKIFRSSVAKSAMEDRGKGRIFVQEVTEIRESAGNSNGRKHKDFIFFMEES
jgi:hypothetical protein